MKNRQPLILCAHPSNDLYGSDLMFVRSIQVLNEGGWKSVVALPEAGNLTTMLQQQEKRTKILAVPSLVLQKSLLTTSRIPFAIIKGITSTFRVWRLIREVNPDVIYVNTITLPSWIVAAFFARKPSIVHVREAEDGLPRYLTMLLLLPSCFASRLIANSEYTAETISRSFSRLRQKTIVIYNGIDLPKPSTQLDTKDCELVLVGRLSYRKGQDIAVEALGILKDRGFDLRLRLVGDHHVDAESYLRELNETIQARELYDRIDFTGYDPEPLRYLNRNMIALVPSRVEPFGNVAVEAMSQGALVIASRVGGLCEIVQDGESGYLFQPGNSRDLADKIQTVLENPESTILVRDQAEISAHERFGSARYAEELNRVAQATASGKVTSLQ